MYNTNDVSLCNLKKILKYPKNFIWTSYIKQHAQYSRIPRT